MATLIQNIITIFESVVMTAFFCYSLVIIGLQLADAVQPKLYDIDRKIAAVVSILGHVYIVAILILCFAFSKFIWIMSHEASASTSSRLYFWISLLLPPLALYVYTQLLQIEKMRNSLWFRGVSAVFFLLFYWL